MYHFVEMFFEIHLLDDSVLSIVSDWMKILQLIESLRFVLIPVYLQSLGASTNQPVLQIHEYVKETIVASPKYLVKL